MLRREFLSASLGSIAAPAQTRRPNVIVIVSDDQGFGDLGCNGSPDAKTPNLDRIAASGVRLADWHANSPVCSPSRASILTGKYPQRAGVPQILTSKPEGGVPGLQEGEKTLASELRAAGYNTGAVGKWHLGTASHSKPLAQGFQEHFGFYSGWIDYYSHRYYALGGSPTQAIFHDLWRNDKEVFEEPGYQTEILGRESRSFLSRQSAAKPFFLYLAFGAPHYPMMAPQRYLERFPAGMDRDRRMHLAVVNALDEAVGGLLDELERKGLARDTAILFQGDNGATHEERADHLSRPYQGGSNGGFRGWKGSLFEGGHRVPSVFRYPAKVKSGQTFTGMGMGMDILPTMLSFAGVPIPAGVDGADLSSSLVSGEKPKERTVFWDYANQRAVRRGDWKLIQNPREFLNGAPRNETWLSNLKDDAKESRNWAAENASVTAELQKATFPF